RTPRWVSSRCQHHTLEPAWVGCAVVGHIPVIGAIEPLREVHGQRRRAKSPGARDNEVNVTALRVHILQTATGVVLCHSGGDRQTPRHARTPGQKAATPPRVRRRTGFLASHALVAQGSDAEHSRGGLIFGVPLARTWLDRPHIWLELVHALLESLIGIAQQHVQGWIDGGVRIDNAKFLSHDALPYEAWVPG